ncbi:MAG: YggU family protein [Acidobacteria bacterium]|nr:MAG: YggU family protein [Acidobacteriota bacterium]
MLEIKEDKDGFTITVRVIPRSSRAEIVGEIEGAVKVRVSSPPVDGAANAEIVRLISKKLGVAKSAVAIVSGETSRTKRLRVSGVNAQKLRDVLGG